MSGYQQGGPYGGPGMPGNFHGMPQQPGQQQPRPPGAPGQPQPFRPAPNSNGPRPMGPPPFANGPPNGHPANGPMSSGPMISGARPSPLRPGMGPGMGPASGPARPRMPSMPGPRSVPGMSAPNGPPMRPGLRPVSQQTGPPAPGGMLPGRGAPRPVQMPTSTPGIHQFSRPTGPPGAPAMRPNLQGPLARPPNMNALGGGPPAALQAGQARTGTLAPVPSMGSGAGGPPSRGGGPQNSMFSAPVRPGHMPPPRPGLMNPPRPGMMTPGVLPPGQAMPGPMAGPSGTSTPTRLGGLSNPNPSFGHGQSSQPGHARQQQLVDQLESLALGPEGPGQPDSTDPASFPRPLDGDGEDPTFPSLDQLMEPEPRCLAQSCDTRIMRCSVAAIPASASLKASWHIPLAVTVRPLADFGEPTPLVDGTASGAIIRCMRCRSYINPFAVWSDGGKKFRCVMCGQLSEVPDEQFVPTDPRTGLRQDIDQRPELTCGTVEYQAPADYSIRPPMPPIFFFVIDVSQPAIQSGALQTICTAIRGCLDSMSKESMTRVGFLTYDTTLHFYNLNPALTAAQMMVVADLEDPFPPLPEDHFVALETGRPAIEKLLDLLPGAFADNAAVETAMGPALQAAFRTINHMGGKIMLFLSAPPNLGPGKIRQREQPGLYNTDREPSLRQPVDTFYKEFTGECISKQITVDVFAMSGHYCDLYSLDVLPRYTSGQLYHYPNFTASRDGEKLTQELSRNLTRQTAWEAVMRLRCSQGLRISTFHGHLYVRTNDLLALPTVDEDDAFVAQIQLEESVVTGPYVHVQCALLFTAANSERRIRVHTLAIPVVSSLHDMFEKSDAISNASILGKLAVEKTLKSRLDETRALVDKRLISQLKEFKALQSVQLRNTTGRLMYPKSMRMLPVWLLGLLKSPALRGASDVNCDERCALSSLILTAPAELIALIAYPALYKLHVGGWGQRDKRGKLVMPQPTPLRMDQLESSGAYLMDAGRVCFIWLGRAASPQLVEDLFGKPAAQMASEGNLQELNLLSVEPARQGSTLSARIQDVLAEKRANRCVWPDCKTVVQGTQMEGYFASFMVEDRIHPGSPSYQDYLLSMYKAMGLR